MTFIVTLGHFCEIHGPSMLACTQIVPKEEDVPKHFSPPIPQGQLCESCRLKLPRSQDTTKPDPSTIQTLPKDAGSTYITTQFPTSQQRYSALRQIIMRVFTIENSSDVNQPLIFGDAKVGYSMALPFKITDTTARGAERRYSLIVTSDKEDEIFANYSLILINMAKCVEFITRRSLEVKEKTKNEDNHDSYLRRSSRHPKTKSLVDLLDDERFFIKLHLFASTLFEELHM